MRNKELYMDYTTGIFTRVNMLKYPTAEEYTARIRADVYKRLAQLNPQIIVAKADATIMIYKPIIDDIEAVNKTFDNLAERDKGYIIDAVKAVYFPYKGKVKIPNEILKERTLAFSMRNYIDERTAYRWLKEARAICAFYRGITVEEPEIL